MAMKKPNAGVVRPETENSIAATGDLNCVTQSSPGCVVQTGIIAIGFMSVNCVIFQLI